MVTILKPDMLIWSDSSAILLLNDAIVNTGLLHRGGRPLHSVALFETMASHHFLKVELLAEFGLLEVEDLGLWVSIAAIQD